METIDVAIIGAGFCGLGTGAALRAAGVERFAILEQGGGPGHFWTTTYDRLHLHSAFHDMPHDGGLRQRYPIFLSRGEVVDYLTGYAEHHELLGKLRTGTRVGRVEHVDPEEHDGHAWRIQTGGGDLLARQAVVATAMNRIPWSPEIRGVESFGGRVLHSASYRNAESFRGRAVLVVGSGNSAAEICLDLVEGGAGAVSMWVRAPRHFIPLRRMTRLFRLFRLLGMMSQRRADAEHEISVGTPEFDRLVAMRDRVIGRLSVDLSRYGIRKPQAGPFAETYRDNRIPTFDQGAIAHIRAGRIRIIDGNERPIVAMQPGEVVLGDDPERFDDVILATGYEPGLEHFIADGELLGPRLGWKSYPITDGRSRSTVHPSIHFPGFDRTPLGGLSLGRWGWETGERVAESLGEVSL